MNRLQFQSWRLVLCAIFLAALANAPGLSAQSPAYRVESFLGTAHFPVALAFTPDGRLFYTEKMTGNVRVVSLNGQLQREPVISLPTDGYVERGMLGIAIDPDYEDNHYIWVYHTQPNSVEPPYPINQIVRFREENGVGSDPQVMFQLPVVTREAYHNGGNIHFGPDGMLYVSIGDIGNAAYAQDLNAVPGRLHRFAVFNDELIPAPDNPYPNNSTYAYGLRNPFDFDFDPITGYIISGENGPQCDDEINLILAGGNYGWRPDYPCDDNAPNDPQVVYPLFHMTPPEAITGVLVYDGDMFPDWWGHIFFCSWNKGIMRRMQLNENRTLVISVQQVDLDNHSCSTDMAVGPEGAIYFVNYDSIYRLIAH